MGQARAPSQGRSKGKAKTKGGGKDKGRTQGQGSGKGSPPRLLRFSWTLCLRPPTSCTYRVAAATRAALAGTPGSVTTSGTIVRCEPSSVKGWRQPRAHNVVRARFLAYPVARVSRLRPLPAGNRPRRPKPHRGTSKGADWGPNKPLLKQRMPRVEMGHPLPPGTRTSPLLRLPRRKTQLDQAHPPHGRDGLLARRRLQKVQHYRQRSTSPWRRLSPKLGSRTKWRPVVCPLPCQSGSGPPPPRGPNPGDFVSLSEVAAALPSVPRGGLEAAAMEVEAEPTVAQSGLETPPANPGSPEYYGVAPHL